MIRSARSLRFFALAALLLPPPTASAQPKPGYSPSSTHVFPAGGRRGTTIPVRVGTECAPGGTDFLIYGTGVSAGGRLEQRLARNLGEPDPRRKPTEIPITYPREWNQEISIAADAPLGQALWRISCAQGGTGTRPFLIGDLPEHIESESNSTPQLAEPLNLPVTLNGQIYGEQDVDFFRLTLRKDQVLVCDVLAGRIGSRLDPLVQLLDTNGRLLEPQEIRIGRDPVLALLAPADGDYLLRVANITFHGNAACVYRITLSTQPLVVSAFPNAGRTDTSSVIQFRTMTGIPGPLTVQNKPIQWRLGHAPLKPWGSRGPTLDVGPERHLVETEPNNSRDQAGTVDVDSTLHGRLDDANDIDRFRFQAIAGKRYVLRATAATPGTPVLPILTLTNQNGKRLGRATSVGNADREARIEWVAKVDTNCHVEIRDLRFGSRGGDDFVYRLRLAEASTGFSLHANTDALNVVQDSSSSLTIRIKRTGGFEAPIELNFEGLPAGVTVEPKQIPAKADSVKLTFHATPDAASHGYPMTITGIAQPVTGNEIDRQSATSQLASRHLGIDNEGLSAVDAHSDQFHLTVCHKPVFRLFCNEAYLYAHRGTVFRYAMQVERLDGFDLPITVQIGDRQNRDLDGIQMIPFVIPPGTTDGFLPIYLPETMHINIQSQSQLYSQAYAHFTDKHGRRQAVLVLSEKRNMLRTRPPVVKMFALDTSLSGTPGSNIRCRLKLERTTNFPGGMTVQLHAVDSASGQTPEFTAATTRFQPGELSATAQIQVPQDLDASAPVTLVFRATGRMPDGTEVISESPVEFLPSVATGLAVAPSKVFARATAKPIGIVAFLEGPAWHPSGNVYFSDGSNNRIMRRDRTGAMHVYRQPSGAANGLLFDLTGRLLACEGPGTGGHRRVTRTEHDGTITVLTNNYRGKKYAGPNDLTIDSKGRIYFTDPRYGPRDGMEIRDQAGRAVEGVYRIDPDGKVTRVITHEVDRPNGIHITPDDRFLYVIDNNNDNSPNIARAVYRFSLTPQGNVVPDSRKTMHDFGRGRGGDGMALDVEGRLYIAAGRTVASPPNETTEAKGGVYVISPEGKQIAFIPIQEDSVTNCTFGGPDRKTLFITAGHTLWSIPTTTAGFVPFLNRIENDSTR